MTRASIDFAIVVQTVDRERQIAVYTYATSEHPEGQRTATVLQLDTGVITDQYGTRWSA